MSTTQIERIQNNLSQLKLNRIAELLEDRLEQASKQSIPYSEFLDELLEEEVAAKKERTIAMRTTMAKFPFIKTLEGFDFNFQPSIDKKRIKELATCRYIPNGDNVILLVLVKPIWLWLWV